MRYKNIILKTTSNGNKTQPSQKQSITKIVGKGGRIFTVTEVRNDDMALTYTVIVCATI